jgi:hypothetical protein
MMIKELKIAIAAHNKNTDVSFNESWNKANNAGSILMRQICKKIAWNKWGGGIRKISLNDAKKWAETLLPPGAGYPSQDCVPGSQMDDLRKELLTL